jgi:His/Glu/Gln/Arg/opine family amino acid ABC transporter permease subunit
LGPRSPPVTIKVSALAIIASVILGMLGACGRVLQVPVLASVIAAYVELIRNTPLLVQIFFVFFGLPSLGIEMSIGALGLQGEIDHQDRFYALSTPYAGDHLKVSSEGSSGTDRLEPAKKSCRVCADAIRLILGTRHRPSAETADFRTRWRKPPSG